MKNTDPIITGDNTSKLVKVYEDAEAEIIKIVSAEEYFFDRTAKLSSFHRLNDEGISYFDLLRRCAGRGSESW